VPNGVIVGRGRALPGQLAAASATLGLAVVRLGRPGLLAVTGSARQGLLAAARAPKG